MLFIVCNILIPLVINLVLGEIFSPRQVGAPELRSEKVSAPELCLSIVGALELCRCQDCTLAHCAHPAVKVNRTYRGGKPAVWTMPESHRHVQELVDGYDWLHVDLRSGSCPASHRLRRV
jgi:hypothetical protein